MGLEQKFNAVEVTVAKTGEIEGYASRFGIKDQGGDIVVKGAFSASLSARTPKMLWQHDPSQPIGKWKSAQEDSTGLIVVGQINMDVQKGREAASLIADGAIDGMSIGYRTRKAKNTKDGRELSDLDLWEVSLVTFPMLKEATVDRIKSIADLDAENPAEMKNFLEDVLRDAGLSRTQAKHGASVLAKEVLGVRDAPDADAVIAEIRQIVRGV